MNHATINVFIIDDSDFSRMTINSMLQEEGFNVVGEAASAKEAIENLNNKQPDIVIIDVVMPEMDGIKLCERISKGLSNTKIIMISSLKHENIVIQAIAAGASDFLQKPIDKQVLVDSIEKLAQDL